MVVVHRFHQTLSAEQLTARTTLHQGRALFSLPPETAIRDKMVGAQVALKRKSPCKVSGRQMFLKDLFAAIRGGRPAGSTLAPSLVKDVMRQHTALYAGLGPPDKIKFDRQAQMHATAREGAISEDLEHIAAKIELHDRRLAEASLERGSTNRLSEARLSDDVLKRLGHKVSALRQDLGEVKRLRAAAATSPPAPPAELQELLASQSVRCLSNMYMPPLADWLKHVCIHRASYRGVILFEGDCDPGAPAFLYLFAQQSPMEACFLELRRVLLKLPEAWAAPDALDRGSGHVFQWEFEYMPVNFISGVKLPIQDWDKAGVLPKSYFERPNLVVSDA